MIDCIILGDSIAKGISQHYVECKNYSVVGISSTTWNKTFVNVDIKARLVIVSLGTNDKNLDTLKELISLRNRIKASRVYWINPACNTRFCNQSANFAVKTISATFNDVIVEINNLSKDGIHPTFSEYKRLSNTIKNNADVAQR